ncbi:hypothetical protein ACROYT_G029504 [Oculina patagonica]
MKLLIEPYTSVTKHSPEFRILSQTITHSSEELSGYRSSCQKLLVFKQLNLQIESCCRGRDSSEQLQNRQRIRDDSVNLQIVAIRQVVSEKIKQIKRVNFKCHQNETCAVTSICLVL